MGTARSGDRGRLARLDWLAGPLLILAVQQVLFGVPVGVVLNGAVLGLITALVASAWPAIRAVRLHPAEAVRHD